MSKYIIKATGNIKDVNEQIKTLVSVFGKDAKIIDIIKTVNYFRINTAIQNQLKRMVK